MVKCSLSSSSEKSMRDHFAWGIPGELAKLPTAAIESIKTLYYVPLAICYSHQVYIYVLMFFVFLPCLPLFPPDVLPDFPSPHQFKFASLLN